jgi:hypothetical protein
MTRASPAELCASQPNSFPHSISVSPREGLGGQDTASTASRRKTGGAAGSYQPVNRFRQAVCEVFVTEARVSRLAGHIVLQNAFHTGLVISRSMDIGCAHGLPRRSSRLPHTAPSLLYHAIFAKRPLGCVLTAHLRASSKSNRPIPNAIGRK